MENNSPNNEQEILRRLAMDDHNALKELFELYADRLYAIIYNYTKSGFIAEELTQEVFIRIWNYRRKLNVVDNASAYLHRMVFNSINTYLKKAANESRLIERAQLWSTATDQSTQETIAANEMQTIISAAVDRLPPQKKTIYRMSKDEGLGHQEIADRLGLSPNTVKNHLAEAVRLMREYLKGHALELSILIIQAIRQ